MIEDGWNKLKKQLDDYEMDYKRKNAYFRWEKAGCPPGDGKEFWDAAEQEWNEEVNKTTNNHERYIAFKGIREIAKGKSIQDILNKLKKYINDCSLSDIVVWDTGTIEFPMMSVVASTCRGWIFINSDKKKVASDFGVSFTKKESDVLKTLFNIWTLKGEQNITSAIKNLYDQSFIKDFPEIQESSKITRDEFKLLINKLLEIVR